ncbi:hypothetical protein EYF80_067158 [Liparis tanakae]|uniref:Uncharacterized protein n=1 Tax=Liparis tanakae TaxID=230148 RepID=A0A4Z2E1V7_9TELE|nr:hypothetical protein EYF80_067158 [Liparis tanakae]
MLIQEPMSRLRTRHKQRTGPAGRRGSAPHIMGWRRRRARSERPAALRGGDAPRGLDVASARN